MTSGQSGKDESTQFKSLPFVLKEGQGLNGEVGAFAASPVNFRRR